MKRDTNEYSRLHKWVEYHLGKPRICWKCGTTKAKRFHWANKSKKYKRELSDFERLCPPCHFRKDFYKKSGVCCNGHKMTPKNTYIKPEGSIREGKRECILCRKASREKYNKKQKLGGA